MKIGIITDTLLQAVVDTIYDKWHHEGRIEVEHTNDFYFTLDEKLYCVQIKEVERIEED